MSNSSLIARIESVLEDVRLGRTSTKSAATSLRNNGRALEAMPYALVKELEDIALDLDIAAWADEDDCVPDLAAILTRTVSWLEQVPRGV